MTTSNLPQTYPVNVIASLFGITPRRVQQLARKGVIPRTGRGEYELVGSVRGYVRYLQDQIAHAQSGGVDVPAERARLMTARADLAEMKIDQRRGILVAAESVETAWTAVFTLLRNRLLALPSRIAPAVYAQQSEASAYAVIEAAIEEALDELEQATPGLPKGG